MRKHYLFVLLTALSLVASAQTQYGVVKTRGRMVNGILQPGKGLADATVKVAGKQAVVSKGNEGGFSFPVAGQNFRLESVQKKGYQLVDMSACTEYKYSENPLRLVMETPEQQQSDLLAAERKIRRNLQQQLHEREDEIEALKVSQQEKDSLLRILYQQQGDNEKLIADMAKRYSTLDYDQLDEFYRQVSWFIENGELTRADSLLRTRGNINAQVQNIIKQGQAIQEQKQELQQAETVHQADIEEAARRCYGYYETFFAQHQNDSASYYLELRASIDTTNVEWQNQAGEYIDNYLAYYSKALEYYLRMLRQSVLQYGEQSDWTATAYNNIGCVYDNQGEYYKALEYHNMALNILEKILGTEHPDVARSYNNIGYILYCQGDYSKALEYHNIALNILEKVLGTEHHYVATSYNNIGLVYGNQGDLLKALEYFSKTLDIQEKVLAKEHPNVASSYNNIGYILYCQGDYSKALEYHSKALEIREKVLGTKHPDVAMSYNNLGLVYHSQGDYAKALEYYSKALNIREEIFSTEHPDVATSYNNIGGVYDCQGDYANALKYISKALDIQEKALGTEHPDVATSYSNIGYFFNKQGDLSKALEYYKKALDIREKVLGTEHPDMVTSYNNIGSVFYCQGDYSKALEYYSKALDIQEKVLGTEHPDVASSYNNIGIVFNSQGDYPKALEYFSKALDIREKVLGAEHPDVAQSYNNIGSVFFNQGDYGKALEYINKALDIQEKAFDTEHPNTKQVMNNAEYTKKAIIAQDPVAMHEYVFTATVADGNTPARQQGMSGEYIVLEFAEWTIKDPTSLLDKNNEMRGKPIDIVIMKGSSISSHHFENTIGVQLDLKHIGKAEKKRIIKEYEIWKAKNNK